MMEAKMMKYHLLSWSIGKILEEDQDRAELLYRYTITRTSEKAGSLCSRICNFLSNIGLAHLLFTSFPPVFKKARKILYTLPPTHDLAIGFWAGGRNLGPRSYFSFY